MAKQELTPQLREQLIRSSPELRAHARTMPKTGLIRGLAEFLSLNPRSTVAEWNAQQRGAQQSRDRIQTHADNKQKLAYKYHKLLADLEKEELTGKREREVAFLSGNKDLVKHLVDVMVSSNTLRGTQSGQFATLLGKNLDATIEYKQKFNIQNSTTETQTAYTDWREALKLRAGPEGINLDVPGNQQQFMEQTAAFLNKATARGDQMAAFGGVDDFLQDNGYGGIEQFMESLEGTSDPETGESASPTIRALERALQEGRSANRASASIVAQRHQDLQKFTGKLEGLQGGFGPGTVMKYIKELNTETDQRFEKYKTAEAAREMDRPDTAGTQERLDSVEAAVQERLPANFERLTPIQQKYWIEASKAENYAEILLDTEVYDNTTQAAFANIQQTQGFKDFFESRDYSNVDEGTRDFIRLQQTHYKEIADELGEGGVRRQAKELRGEIAKPVYDPTSPRIGALQKRLEQPAAAESVGGAIQPTDEEKEPSLINLAKPSVATQYWKKQIGKTGKTGKTPKEEKTL